MKQIKEKLKKEINNVLSNSESPMKIKDKIWKIII
jgi:hypothetical protein